jgi:argininosuccinate lyase
MRSCGGACRSVAHRVVGSIVAEAERAGHGLADVSDATIVGALGASGDASAAALASDPGIGDLVRAAAGLDAALDSCDVVGGTAPVRVQKALAEALARLEREDAAD